MRPTSKFCLTVNLQQKVNELRSWTDQLENLESFSTDNELVFVDCWAVAELMLNRIRDILQRTCEFVVAEAMGQAEAFCKDMDVVLAVRAGGTVRNPITVKSRV